MWSSGNQRYVSINKTEHFATVFTLGPCGGWGGVVVSALDFRSEDWCFEDNQSLPSCHFVRRET